MDNFGIVNTKMQIVTNGAKTIKTLAISLLRKKMREESSTSISDYMNGWANTMNEIEECDEYTAENVIGIAVGNLVSTNIHLVKRHPDLTGWTDFTSNDKKELAEALENLIEA